MAVAGSLPALRLEMQVIIIIIYNKMKLIFCVSVSNETIFSFLNERKLAMQVQIIY